jgi:3-oxoacyl-[acyl-carrier-protein] synthase III
MGIYINDVAAYLPNGPVDNDHIEEIVGRILNLPSRIKRRILNNDKIERRYYRCFIPESGRFSMAYMMLMVV